MHGNQVLQQTTPVGFKFIKEKHQHQQSTQGQENQTNAQMRLNHSHSQGFMAPFSKFAQANNASNNIVR